MSKRVNYKCSVCGKDVSVSYATHWKWEKDGRPELCLDCSKEYARKKFAETIQNRSPEERERARKHNSDAQKKYWKNLSKQDADKKRSKFIDARDKFISSLSEEDLQSLKERRKKGLFKWMNSLTDEKLEEIQEQSKKNVIKAILYNRTHREEFAKRAKDKWNHMTEYERQNKLEGLRRGNKKWRDNMTACEARKTIEQLLKKRKEWFLSLSEEERNAYFKSQTVIASKFNKLHQRFESYFHESYINNTFSYESEYVVSNNNVTHSWDYGIFDENGDLQMVVDLDGKFFHADECDYNGIHSREENDERRFLSIPDGVKYHIIYEYEFTKSFEEMIKKLMVNYDQFVEEQFHYCRLLPDLPYMTYNDIALTKSYDQLCRLKTDDKYHQSISLNNREGDKLINHFHHSIYSAKRKDSKKSPYEAWYDDDLLRKIIKNRIIYINKINPNKILQGFNIAKVAMKVSVFSAGRAKLIISRYLDQFNIIFDPFSGFSGRMLGTIASGKKYIGQDISEIHLHESSQIIEFLKQHGYSPEVELHQKDINCSRGEYPCLFTCPPYRDKEQWLDVPIDMRTCDDWIDLCLSNFKCQRYVFVVDHTEKYQDYIVDEITNKSHMNKNSEYVICIDK